MVRSSFKLQQLPNDSISKMLFVSRDDQSTMLLVSSWDKGLYIYNVAKQKLVQRWDAGTALMSCTAKQNQGETYYSAGLDGNIRRHLLDTQNSEVIGNHSDGIISLNSSACQRFLISGSWDKTIALWDERCSTSNQKTVLIPSKPISMDINDTMVVVATADKKIYLNDLRKCDSFIQKRESPLRHQISSIRWFPNKEGFACASVEGRVAIDFINDGTNQKYAFKCHREIIHDKQREIVYPVFDISFASSGNTFATGGGDGNVNIWDVNARKRICQLGKYNDSISALAFSNDDKYFAISSSYCFERGASRKMIEKEAFIEIFNGNFL